MAEGPSSDAADLAERLAIESTRLLARREIAHVELYLRTSTSVRATRERVGGRRFPRARDGGGRDEPARERDHDDVTLRRGHEEGIAVRLWCVPDGCVRFAAATGCSTQTIDLAVERALASAPAAPGSTVDRRDGGPFLTDPDESPLPDPTRLAACLAAAWSDPRCPTPPDRGWVEAARTVETWVVDGEPVASRTRARGWAGLVPATGGPPVVLADRSWTRLDPRAWVRELAWRRAAAERNGGSRPAGRGALLVSPDAAATLVLTLVRAVGADGPDVPVGPGFRVRDAPREQGALFGGLFDDLGFYTSLRPVADGRAWLGGGVGRGCYRRPSFRDLPLCLPSHLVVDPPPHPLHYDGWVASRCAVHPLAADRWIVELEAVPWHRGEPCGGRSRGQVATSPGELLARCTAGVGPQVDTHRGVRTPGLLFEGLDLRF